MLITSRIREIPKQFVRCSSLTAQQIAEKRKKTTPTYKALCHFDDFYGKVFDKKWNSIRHGLLGLPKYAAVVNNYSNPEAVATELANRGAINIRTLFNLEKQYIKERREDKRKRKLLEEIQRLDEELEQKSTNDIKEDGKKDYSLQKSLADAEYDESRIVDSRNALSAEVLYQFVPTTKIKGREDWIPESDHYRYYDISTKEKIKIIPQYDIHFPEHLNVYCFEPDNFTKFGSPKMGETKVFDYYLLDGGSLLPILALDLRPGQSLLDMCGSPGGKSLLAIQTLYPQRVVCNDLYRSRVDRIFTVFKEYLFDLNERWLDTGRLQITCKDGRNILERNFDRVLVDVPCTTDRHSVKEDDNNIFKSSRIKERLKLPELQSELLIAALKLVKPGGIVVYSTCSLSPIQNDGVVKMALNSIHEERDIEFAVCNMSEALQQIKAVYKLADPMITKFGHLIVPYISKNFGPTYFCKLQRIK